MFERVLAIADANTNDLRALAIIAGADPAVFYRGANLSDIDLRGQDLRGMDFEGATLAGILIDETTVLDGEQERLFIREATATLLGAPTRPQADAPPPYYELFKLHMRSGDRQAAIDCIKSIIHTRAAVPGEAARIVGVEFLPNDVRLQFAELWARQNIPLLSEGEQALVEVVEGLGRNRAVMDAVGDILVSIQSAKSIVPYALARAIVRGIALGLVSEQPKVNRQRWFHSAATGLHAGPLVLAYVAYSNDWAAIANPWLDTYKSARYAPLVATAIYLRKGYDKRAARTIALHERQQSLNRFDTDEEFRDTPAVLVSTLPSLVRSLDPPAAVDLRHLLARYINGRHAPKSIREELRGHLVTLGVVARSGRHSVSES